MHPVYIVVDDMEKLKKLGFKKVRGTEPGFHIYELTPATLRAHDQQPLTTKEYNRIKNAKKNKA